MEKLGSPKILLWKVLEKATGPGKFWKYVKLRIKYEVYSRQ